MAKRVFPPRECPECHRLISQSSTGLLHFHKLNGVTCPGINKDWKQHGSYGFIPAGEITIKGVFH